MKRGSLTVEYVARLFDIDESLVELWSDQFAEYLSKPTNRKDEPRIYTQSDLKILAVIYDNHDASDDTTAASSGAYLALNSGSQDDKRYREFAYLNSPVFQEVPDEFEHPEPGVYSAIIADIEPSWIDVARAYRLAADMIIDAALEKADESVVFSLHDVALPILFNYRHCIEVYLKTLTDYSHKPSRGKKKENGHIIENLVESLREKYKPLKINDWIENLLNEWGDVDHGSTAFRYPGQIKGGEYWIDFYHLKAVMGILCDAFDERFERGNAG
jgi:hypothetical protein